MKEEEERKVSVNELAETEKLFMRKGGSSIRYMRESVGWAETQRDATRGFVGMSHDSPFFSDSGSLLVSKRKVEGTKGNIQSKLVHSQRF